jgi:hypothetical protein
MSESDSHSGHDHDHEYVEVKVALEVEHMEMLEEIAKEYGEKLGQDWDVSAVVRVAVGNLLTKFGKMA